MQKLFLPGCGMPLGMIYGGFHIVRFEPRPSQWKSTWEESDPWPWSSVAKQNHNLLGLERDLQQDCLKPKPGFGSRLQGCRPFSFQTIKLWCVSIFSLETSTPCLPYGKGTCREPGWPLAGEKASPVSTAVYTAAYNLRLVRQPPIAQVCC